MPPLHARAGLRALSFMLLFACSSAAEKASSACEGLARARCEREQRCAASDFRAYFEDMADCVAMIAEDCRLKTTLPDSRYDAPTIEACTAAVSGGGCDGHWGYMDLPACREPAGTRKRGDTCTDSVQCASRFCIFTSLGSRCGRCEDTSSAGGPCNASLPCDDGLFCDGGRCRAYVGEGSSCESGFDCQGALVCRDGRCARRLPTGSACVDSSSGCEGSFSDCYGGTCVATQILSPGAACGSTLNGPPRTCGAPYVCDLGSHACQRVPKAGEACQDSGGFCRGIAYCWQGKCENPEAAFCPASGEK